MHKGIIDDDDQDWVILNRSSGTSNAEKHDHHGCGSCQAVKPVWTLLDSKPWTMVIPRKRNAIYFGFLFCLAVAVVGIRLAYEQNRSHFCTLMGCISSVSFQTIPLPVTNENYEYEVCVDSSCIWGSVFGFPYVQGVMDGNWKSNNNRLLVDVRGDSSSSSNMVTQINLPTGYDYSKARFIQLKVVHQATGKVVLRASTTKPTFKCYEPNGPFCEPLCCHMEWGKLSDAINGEFCVKGLEKLSTPAAEMDDDPDSKTKDTVSFEDLLRQLDDDDAEDEYDTGGVEKFFLDDDDAEDEYDTGGVEKLNDDLLDNDGYNELDHFVYIALNIPTTQFIYA